MKYWLYERWLPMWAKETLLRENRQLRRDIGRLRRQLREREAYIKGVQKGLSRAQSAKRKTQNGGVATRII